MPCARRKEVTSQAKAVSMKRTPTPSKPASRIISSWVCSGHSGWSVRRRSIAQSDCRIRSCCAIASRPQWHGGGVERTVGRIVDGDAFLIGLGTAPDRECCQGGEQRGIACDRPPAAERCYQCCGHERRRAAGQQRPEFAGERKTGEAPLRREQFGEVRRLRA